MLNKRDRILSESCTIRDEMQMIARSAAEPWSPGDSIKAAMQRASRNLGMPYSRVRSFWYAAADAWAHEADTLRAWKRARDQAEFQRLSNRLQELQAQIEAGDQ